MARDDYSPVYHPSQPKSSGAGRPRTSSSSGGKGGKAKATDPYAAAEARANANVAKAKRDAAKNSRDQAARLQQQVDALRTSLGANGFKRALDIRLANVSRVLGQQDAVMMEGYRKRVDALDGADADNTKAAGDQGFANLNNRGRERANAVSEAMSHGAGESDLMQSQMMALRNWSANQGEGNRAFYDGQRSINSSLTDLNIDTKTGRLNLESQANADRDQLWTQYYNQKGEAYTQLGNTLGAQADLYGSAVQNGDKASNTRRKQKDVASGVAFDAAASMTGQAYTNPGASKALMDWQGDGQYEGELNTSNFANAQTLSAPRKKPSGSNLRSW